MLVSMVPYIGLLVGGLNLQLLHSLVFWIKFSDTLVLLLLIKLLFMLVTVSDPKCHAPSRMTHMLPFIRLGVLPYPCAPTIFETYLSIMEVDPMGPEVWNSPPFWLLLLGRAGSLGVLTGQFSFEGLDLLLYMAGYFFQFWHVRVLVHQMVGVFGHLGSEVHVGASEVIHFFPFLRCRLGKVGKCLLYTYRVVGSVSSLSRCFM